MRWSSREVAQRGRAAHSQRLLSNYGLVHSHHCQVHLSGTTCHLAPPPVLRTFPALSYRPFHSDLKHEPLFVPQELLNPSHPAIRNNITIALSDLCVESTALVDHHLPTLAKTLSDGHPLVRQQALALLFKLLQKDYVKWRSPIVLRLLLALVDGEPEIRHTAEFLVADAVATKAPLLAYNYFHEVLFVLNGCQVGIHAEKSGFTAVGIDEDEAGSAGVRGSSRRARCGAILPGGSPCKDLGFGARASSFFGGMGL